MSDNALEFYGEKISLIDGNKLTQIAQDKGAEAALNALISELQIKAAVVYDQKSDAGCSANIVVDDGSTIHAAFPRKGHIAASFFLGNGNNPEQAASDLLNKLFDPLLALPEMETQAAKDHLAILSLRKRFKITPSAA